MTGPVSGLARGDICILALQRITNASRVRTACAEHVCGDLIEELLGERAGSGFGGKWNPAYVDVAIERWQSFTDLEAVLAEFGESVAALGVKRLGAAAASN